VQVSKVVDALLACVYTHAADQLEELWGYLESRYFIRPSEVQTQLMLRFRSMRILTLCGVVCVALPVAILGGSCAEDALVAAPLLSHLRRHQPADRQSDGTGRRCSTHSRQRAFGF
jgi:hypothetical protein